MKKVMMLGLVLTLLLSPLVAYAVTAAGNKVCPVSGDQVSGKDFVEYGGIKYGLCCPMCAATFKKNPDKYIADLAKQQEAHEHFEHSK